MKSIQAFLLAAVLTASAAAYGCSETKQSSSSSGSEADAQPVSPESISFEWQKAYQSKLDEFKSSADFGSSSAFDLYDVTGDGDPELIISPNTEKSTACKIYTFSDGSAAELASAGFDGEFEYLPEAGLIREEYRGDGFIIGKFRKFEEGAFTDFLTYSDNSESASAGATIKHEINGEEVLLPQYDSALAPYVEALTLRLGRKFTFGDASVNYAIRRGESWGAVLSKKQKQSCKNKLSELAASAESKDAAFELCDLNGDDIPEVIVSAGTAADSPCSIYYFGGDELAEVEGSYGSYGRLYFDIEKLVFYSGSETGMMYWSLADSSFSADSYTDSGSIMEAGRKYPLDPTGIDASLV